MSDKIAQLFAAWGMTDANGAQAQTLRECLGDPFTYVDPRTPAPITGADGVCGLCGDVHRIRARRDGDGGGH